MLHLSMIVIVFVEIAVQTPHRCVANEDLPMGCPIPAILQFNQYT